MRHLRRIALALVAAVGLAPAVLAAREAKPAGTAASGFEVADFDGDGKVTWEEFRNRVAKVFGHLDHNSDGRLTGDEHPPATGKDGKEARPGNVTAESFTAAAAEAFKAADKDGDGALSLSEWSGS